MVLEGKIKGAGKNSEEEGTVNEEDNGKGKKWRGV
jgi:hypothetical protein